MGVLCSGRHLRCAISLFTFPAACLARFGVHASNLALSISTSVRGPTRCAVEVPMVDRGDDVLPCHALACGSVRFIVPRI